MSTQTNKTLTSPLFPPPIFVKEGDVAALKDPQDVVHKISAIAFLSGLYAIDTIYYAGRTVSSAFQLPFSLLGFLAFILAPENSLLQKSGLDLVDRLDGLPSFVANVFKTMICASAVLLTPFRSPNAAMIFYSNCQKNLSLEVKPEEKPVSSSSIPPFSALKWISPEIKDAFNEILNQIDYNEKAKLLGLDSLSSTILTGPPGNGKTYIAQSLSSEIALRHPEKKPEFHLLKMEELTGSYVGQTTVKLNDYKNELIKRAQKGSLVVLLIDEIDMYTINRETDRKLVKEYEMVLKLIMSTITELKTLGGIVLAATNQLESIDAALLRAGRLDRIVNVPNPTLFQLLNILTDFVGSIDQQFVAVDLQHITPNNQALLLPLLDGLSLAEVEDAVKRAKQSILTTDEKVSFSTISQALAKTRTSRWIAPTPFLPSELLATLEKLLNSLEGERVERDLIKGCSSVEKEAMKAYLTGLSLKDVVNIFLQAV